MVSQMKVECCSISPNLDVDQLLRELQDRGQEAKDFTRIGPFGILPISSIEPLSRPQLPHMNGLQNPIEEIHLIPTPEILIPLSESVWNETEDFQIWDSPDLETSSPLVNSNLNSSIEMLHSNFDPTSALITTPGDIYTETRDDLAASLYESLQDQAWDAEFLNCRCSIINSNHLCRPFLTQAGFITPQDSEAATSSEPQIDTSAILTMPNDANLSRIPAEARSLLDYYSSRIIYVMTMSPGRKPPWKVIHLPCAMSALAELMVFGEASSLAKMALFYALLSISSFHVSLVEKGLTERSQYWFEKGISHKAKSKFYLRSSLDRTLPKSSRGKYKEVLMSLLSMVTIGVTRILLLNTT